MIKERFPCEPLEKLVSFMCHCMSFLCPSEPLHVCLLVKMTHLPLGFFILVELSSPGAWDNGGEHFNHFDELGHRRDGAGHNGIGIPLLAP
jgi:hypothetical protein